VKASVFSLAAPATQKDLSLADHRLWKTAADRCRLGIRARIVNDEGVFTGLCPLQPVADIFECLLFTLPDNARRGIGFPVIIDRDDHARVYDER
jgi:hypothetical protein